MEISDLWENVGGFPHLYIVLASIYYNVKQCGKLLFDHVYVLLNYE